MGNWTLPGGNQELRDTILQGAARELEEETNVKLRGYDAIGRDPAIVAQVLKRGTYDSLAVPQAYMGIDWISRVKSGGVDGRVRW